MRTLLRAVVVPFLLLLSVGSLVRAQDRFAALYDACGGIELCGVDESCYSCLESECVRSGAYYWQCRDDQIEGTSESNDGGGGNDGGVATNPTNPNLEELWRSYPLVADNQPCGGIRNHPCGLDAACAICASDNFICLRSNEWYYQCVEDTSNPGGGGASDNGNNQEEEDSSSSPANEDQNDQSSNDQSSNDGIDPVIDQNDQNGEGDVSIYPLVEDYGPCGGIDNHPCALDEACADCVSNNFICARGNEWYWQCVEDTTGGGGGGGDNQSNPGSNTNQDQSQSDNDTNDEGTNDNGAAVTPNQPTSTPVESGTAATTTFFDGCKPSCAWPGNIMQEIARGPVFTCANTFDEGTGQQLRNPESNPNLKNVCAGGGTNPTDPNGSVAYSCVDRQPWTDSSTGQNYAFAARNSLDSCCKCYKLTFLDVSIGRDGSPCSPDCSKYRGELQGESLVIQVINTGGDVAAAQFDIMIPGFGFGIFDGVTQGVNGPGLFQGSDPALWGQRYGGLDQEGREACDLLPEPVRAGCRWQFDQFLNSDNPGVTYERVSCALHPELVEKSGCLLLEDTVS